MSRTNCGPLVGFGVVALVAIVGCDNGWPSLADVNVLREIPHSRDAQVTLATEAASTSPFTRTAQAAAPTDKVEALSPVPGCRCGPGYYPRPAAEPFYQASLTATREGRFKDALESASRAASVGGSEDTYRNQLAIALFNAGRTTEAVAQWEEIARGSPNGCELGFYADALIRLGRPAEAERVSRKYVEQCGNSSNAHYLLASALYDLGRLDSAEQAASQSIKLEQSEPNGYRLRSLIFEKTGRLELALGDARAAVRLKSDFAEYHEREASVLWEMDRYEEARKPISIAAKLAPKNAGIQYLRSMILEQVGQLDEALQAAKDAVDIKPRDADYLRQLGDIYSSLKRRTEAIAAFDRSLALKFTPGALYGRAMCHAEIGQRDAALRDLRELDRKSPGYLNTRAWIESLEGQ